MIRLLSNTNIDFQSKRRLAMLMSSILILIGLISLVLRGGPNYSIDFSGGLSLLLRFHQPEGMQPIDEEMVRGSLEKIGLANSEVKLSRSTEGEDLMIRLKEEVRYKPPEALIRARLDQELENQWRMVPDDRLNAENMPELTGYSYVAIETEADDETLEKILNSVDIENPKLVKQKTTDGDDVILLAGEGKDTVSRLMKTLSEDYPNYSIDIRSIDSVGPRIGSELRFKALGAVFATLLLIVIYLWWRFELLFGIAAVIALFHDVLITLGIFSILNVEISLVIVGAFLTLVGYSLNDTIVVFDRIRENLKRYKNKTYTEVINDSINATLSRTVITSGTTMLVVLILFFFGGEVLHSFALALLIGIIVGTYSSIFIASPILIEWELRTGKGDIRYYLRHLCL
jgi:preprotein translocase subunit SecF